MLYCREYDIKSATPFNVSVKSHPESRKFNHRTSFEKKLDFAAKIEQEFCKGSTIDSALFKATVAIRADLETLPGGDVCTPIHDALGWTYTRFGYRAKESLFAAMLVNEDGSYWQLKLSDPLTDQKKGKTRKYESPKGGGSRAFFPVIPSEIRQKISARHEIEVPLEGTFWQWLESHPEVPIILTEGGKKALSLLSLGYVAIALYGVNGGYKKLPGDVVELIPDLQCFALPSRKITLAFDQDVNVATRNRVNTALARFGTLLNKAGCSVTVAFWESRLGKGVDDLIVTNGPQSWEKSYAEALPLTHWRLLQQFENRLSYPTSLRINSANLSDLEIAEIPETGIIAIASPKGTGKTKFLARNTGTDRNALLLGHRVALARNLCERLGLDYRGDIQGANKAGVISDGDTYRIGIGTCVDSLLAINSTTFSGCDLILDEVVQVVRHLLTSSTCSKEGRRPALLARFTELIRTARRVILADADLDNQTLHYIQELRNDNAPAFLIRNDFKPEGYPVRFIYAKDRSPIIAELLSDIKRLEQGKTLLVATDSKATSKLIAALVEKQFSGRKTLLINSDTSGNDEQRSFIERPDQSLSKYDVVIATPSMATGVSIEAKGVIAKVYGVFTGASSTDADIAQALGRVREPVERVVWCSEQGRNFNKVSRSSNRLEFKNILHSRTNVTVALTRAELGVESLRQIEDYDWQSDPHLNYYCHIAAEQNAAMYCLRDALLIRLRHEGNDVREVGLESEPAFKLLLKNVRVEMKAVDAEALVTAPIISPEEALELKNKEHLDPDEQRALERFRFCDFYCLEPDTLDVDFVLADRNGTRQRELFNLECQLFPDVATEHSANSIVGQTLLWKGLCPWDISGAELRRKLREAIGLNELIDKIRDGWEWHKGNIAPYANRARAAASEIKKILHFTIPNGFQPDGTPKISDVQIINQLLKQLGIKAKKRNCRTLEGFEGDLSRVYSLDTSRWEELMSIVEKRRARREAPRSVDASPSLMNKHQGDASVLLTVEDISEWLAPGCLQDICSMMVAASSASAKEELRNIIPIKVWEMAEALQES